MNISGLSSSFALARAVASLSSAGKTPVGSDVDSRRISTAQASAPAKDSSNRPFPAVYMPSGSVSERPPMSEATDLAADKNATGSDTRASSDENDAKTAMAKRQEQLDQQEIKQLSARDREVRAHEQAHASIGGQYAGAAQFQYQQGPDGVRYAVAGEVPIDIGREATPEETLRKAQIVKRAALAPAEPSPQDRRVAAEATRLEAEAKQDLVLERAKERTRSESSEDSSTEDRADIAEPSGAEIPVDTPAISSQAAATSVSRDTNVSTNSNVLSSSSYRSSLLNLSIANTALSSNEPGSILDQLV